jgi:CRISPR-associated protein Cas1
MIGRVVEIAREGAHLSVERGFLRVSESGTEVGRVAIGDIGALIVRGYGATISLNLCSRLSAAGIPVVLCDPSQSPDTVIWPIQGNFEQGRRMQAQADASRPLRKRLWRDLVIAKIRAQADVLNSNGKQSERLRQLARAVKSGDPENTEAQAARYYWPTLFGDAFRRSDSGEPTNSLLNYGYTVLRAAAARSILAAGLHPSLSLHHESRGDALRLADDLMEPFRPFVDLIAANRVARNQLELNPEAKSALASVLTLDLTGPRGARTVQQSLDALASSLAGVFMSESRSLDLPSGLLEISAGVA